MLSSFFRRAFFETAYWRGRPRWDTGVTPPELIDLVERRALPPGRALDIGCGTGTNVIYLAQHGFDVTGLDYVPRAILRAQKRARAAHVRARFLVTNVLEPLDLGEPFDLLLDIGCFHGLAAAERGRYARNVESWTREGATFLLYAFFPASTRTRRFGLTSEEVEATFAPHWRVVESSVGHDGDRQDSAWYELRRS